VKIDVIRTLLVFLICGAGVFLSRVIPFVLFRGGSVPPIVSYLGKVLPMAIMSVLIIYCIKTVSFRAAGSFVPELAGIAVTALLHLWRKNTTLSIFCGTACYMLLQRLVF